MVEKHTIADRMTFMLALVTDALMLLSLLHVVLSHRYIHLPPHLINRPNCAPHTSRANAAKSAVRAHVEHVFAHQKGRYGLFIRTIVLARAQAKLTLANLAYNFDRLIFHERRAATG